MRISTIVLLMPLLIQAQELKIIGAPVFEKEELVYKQIKDSNGDICAGLIIYTDLVGLSFQSNNGIVKVNHEPGKDYLFLSPDERVVEIYCDKYTPLKIYLYEIGIKLKSGQTWSVKISGNKAVDSVSITILSNPENSKIVLNGIDQGGGNQFKVPIGRHILQVSKLGYESKSESIDVNTSSTLFRYKLSELEQIPVNIKSLPSQAKVYINEVEQGETDMGVFLYPGKYTVKLTKTGYFDTVSTIDVYGVKPLDYTYNLKSSSAKLVLNVKPTDAIVMVDREVVPNIGNIKVFPGRHKIEIKKEGYVSISDLVELISGEKKEMEYSLVPIVGKLEFTIKPKDADVELSKDGKVIYSWRGQKTIKDVPVGKYLLKASKTGFESLEKNISINELAENREDLVLNPLITVKSIPSQAKLYINEVERGETDMGIYLYPGKYSVKLSKSGFNDTMSTIEVDGAKSLEYVYSLKSSSAKLVIDVIPTDAIVSVDRENISNLSNIKVFPGRHKIEIKKEGFVSISDFVELKSGETKSKQYSMVPIVGKLEFSIKPIDADVELSKDGNVLYSWKGLKIIKDIPVGKYLLKANKSGYESIRKSISINELGVNIENVSLNMISNDSKVLTQSKIILEKTEPSTKREIYPKGSIYFQSGLKKFNLDEKSLDQVLDFYQQYLTVNSRNVEAYFMLGESYFLKGDLPKAQSALERVLDFDDEYEPALIGLIKVYAKNGFLDKAIKIFNLSQKYHKSSPLSAVALGQMYLESKLFDDASIYFSKAKEIDSKCIEAYIAFSEIYFAQNVIVLASENLRIATELAPTDPTLLFRIGLSYFHLKDTVNAIIYLEKTLTLDKYNMDAVGTLAAIYLTQKKYDRAVLEYEKMLAKDPKNLTALYWSAYSYFVLDKIDKAKTYYKIIVSMRPNNPQYHQTLVQIYSLQDSADLGRYHATLMIGLADSIMKADPSKAVQQTQMILGGYRSLALFDYKEKNIKGSIEKLEKAISFEVSKQDLSSHLFLAQMYAVYSGDRSITLSEAQNVRNKACKEYAVVLKLDPNNIYAKKESGQMNCGQ